MQRARKKVGCECIGRLRFSYRAYGLGSVGFTCSILGLLLVMSGFNTVEARKLEHAPPPTPNQGKMNTSTNHTTSHVPTFWSLLQNGEMALWSRRRFGVRSTYLASHTPLEVYGGSVCNVVS